MAGLKDRQGVTIQYMSVPVKKPVWLAELDIVIEPEGFADEQLESRHSQGNAFEVRLRGLTQQRAHASSSPSSRPCARTACSTTSASSASATCASARAGSRASSRSAGTRRRSSSCSCSPSDQDDDQHARFKQAWRKCWGDWRRCRDIAGQAGAHHSVFEHLTQASDRFRRRVPLRLLAPAPDPPLRLAVAPLEPHGRELGARDAPAQGRASGSSRSRGGSSSRAARCWKTRASATAGACPARASRT